MARDWDFKPVKTTESKPTYHRQTFNRPQRAKKSLWLLIVGLLLVGAALYWQFQQPSTASVPPTNTLINLDASTDLTANVSVYSSNSDLASCQEIVAKITKLKYSASCLGQALNQHPTNEIWYGEDQLTAAQKINSTLELNASLKLLSSVSQYNIVIYLSNN